MTGARGTHAAKPQTGRRLQLEECESFLVHEARLLDEGRFDEWLTLFTQDARYWVPSEPDQVDPFDTVSLMYDDRRLLETRVRRLSSPRIYSQEPRSRTSRMIGNISIEDDDGAASMLVRSKFVLIEFRRNEQRLFGGTCFHRLIVDEGAIRIALKQVNLVNCDAPLDGLVVPF
jgi:benzoate/toluate 1,2-dioxygenase beta subunit